MPTRKHRRALDMSEISRASHQHLFSDRYCPRCNPEAYARHRAKHRKPYWTEWIWGQYR